jgi:hypothetical protein
MQTKTVLRTGTGYVDQIVVSTTAIAFMGAVADTLAPTAPTNLQAMSPHDWP